MRISESAARDCALVDLPTDVAARVTVVGRDVVQRLAAQGIHVGSRVTVETDAPFGGPRVVRLGSARIAVARAITRSIVVHPDKDPIRHPR